MRITISLRKHLSARTFRKRLRNVKEAELIKFHSDLLEQMLAERNSA